LNGIKKASEQLHSPSYKKTHPGLFQEATVLTNYGVSYRLIIRESLDVDELVSKQIGTCAKFTVSYLHTKELK